MATLKSDDSETPSSIELYGNAPAELVDTSAAPANGERWQRVSIKLNTVRVQIQSTNDEGFTLCRMPLDEPAKLVHELSKLLASECDTVLFEPQEPSFELNFQRTHHGGIKVEAWIDSGNAQTGFYRWDSAGIRFFTTTQLIDTFVAELKREFQI